jgi:uncharacterized protein (TIGR04255 family)
MVATGEPLPIRIDPDAIIEALFELRFDAVSPLPEVLFGRLASVPAWSSFQARRLPTYDLPAQFRDSDANLRFVPIFELASTEPPRAIRVGGHVLSYHLLAPYTGWTEFSKHLEVALENLFKFTDGLRVTRLGLRYINVLTQAKHGVGGIRDLDLELSVSQAPLETNMSLTLIKDVYAQTQCKVVVATKEHVQGVVPPDTSVVVDVDVATVVGFSTDSAVEVRTWLDQAHISKNQAFLCLLKRGTLDAIGRAQ